jgi:hypothetical protein
MELKTARISTKRQLNDDELRKLVKLFSLLIEIDQRIGKEKTDDRHNKTDTR